MLDIKFVRNNPEVVKQNIKNKFQDDKLPLVDEVIELDQRNREIKQEVEALRADKNQISKQIGACMAQGKKEEAEELKKKVQENAERVEALSKEEKEVEAKIKQNMMIIPNIIDPSVPIGKDDSENVEIEKFGEPVVPDYEIPYHTDIMESFNGIDLESAGKMCIRDRWWCVCCAKNFGDGDKIWRKTCRSRRIYKARIFKWKDGSVPGRGGRRSHFFKK